MLITLELLLCTDLRRSMLTVGELQIGYGPELMKAINDFAEQQATTPPGVWVRSYKSRNYLTQSVPGLAFFTFLRDWRGVPIVGEFLDKHYGIVMPSAEAMPETRTNVWIGSIRLLLRWDCR